MLHRHLQRRISFTISWSEFLNKRVVERADPEPGRNHDKILGDGLSNDCRLPVSG